MKVNVEKNLTPEEKELEKKASNLINTIRNHKDYDFLYDDNKKWIDKIERQISSQRKIDTIKEPDIKNLEYILTEIIPENKNKKLFEEYAKSDEYKKFKDLYDDLDEKLYSIKKIDKHVENGNKEYDDINNGLKKLYEYYYRDSKYYNGKHTIEEFKKNVQQYTQELENLGKKISELLEKTKEKKAKEEVEEQKRKDEYDKKRKEEYHKKYDSFSNEYHNSDEYKKLSSMALYFQKFISNLVDNEDIENNDPSSLFGVNIVKINNYLNTLLLVSGKQVENDGVDYYKKKCKETYDKYENLLNKVKSFDKKNKITNESSYDLIDNILTIFENSF